MFISFRARPFEPLAQRWDNSDDSKVLTTRCPVVIVVVVVVVLAVAGVVHHPPFGMDDGDWLLSTSMSNVIVSLSSLCPLPEELCRVRFSAFDGVLGIPRPTSVFEKRMIEKLCQTKSGPSAFLMQQTSQADAMQSGDNSLSDFHGNFEFSLLNVSQQLHLVLSRERNRADQHFKQNGVPTLHKSALASYF